MTEINRRTPVSLVRGSVDLGDLVESVDLADLCGSSGDSVEGYRPVSFQLNTNRLIFIFSVQT
jgi:hypothetical protein